MIDYLFYAVICFCFSATFDAGTKKTPVWLCLIRQIIATVLSTAALVFYCIFIYMVINHMIAH
jgi:hypothetical protein